jgi:hypothetical protein
MKVNFIIFNAIVLISYIVLLSCCKKEVSYPLEPVIKFKDCVIIKSIMGKDSALKLTISYTDGDGDLGLGQNDINPPFNSGTYYFNMYVNYYELNNGKWSEVTLDTFSTDTVRIKYRFPNLTPNSDNKAIKGEIENTFGLPTRNSLTSIKLKFYIYDRMLHKSNIDSTGILTYYNPY